MKVLKGLAIVVLGVIVFNIFFDRASKSADDGDSDDVAAVLKAIEGKVQDDQGADQGLRLPIEKRLAAEYVIARTENGDGHTLTCAVSRATGSQQRAQTMINVVLEVEVSHPNARQIVELAPHEALCSDGRLLGITYYVPSAEGWKGVKAGSWKWHILTTNHEVTEQQITDTLMYQEHIDEFKKEHGPFDYSEELELFLEDELGHSPEYVTSGLWVDDYYAE